jgi:tetratricopeptide (TPR) repeat protein
MEFRQALENGLASEAMATEVRNNRSLMFGRKLAGIMHYHLGDFETAREYLEGAIALSRSMGSSNFLAQGLRQLAMVYQKLDDLDHARKCAFEALEAIRKVGMTFIGPTVLATCAHVTEDNQRRLALLEEAEAILDSGCVAHNQLWFADIAIDDALSKGEWQSALRYADRLERYTASQPLQWSTFMVRRARGLVAVNNGDKSDPILAELRDLKQQAERSGLMTSLPALEVGLGV